MAEKYLTGAILEDGGRLTDQSVKFLRKGCGLTDFKLPVGNERFSVINDPPLLIAAEKNIGLARGVAEGKYLWAVVGLDMVADLPDDLRDKVRVLRPLGFGQCEIRVGVSALFFGVETLAELPTGTKAPSLRELAGLTPKTRVATKYPNYLNRVMDQGHLNLRVVNDPTPESAPKFRNIFVVADVSKPDDKFGPNQILEGELLLASEAVLLISKHMPRRDESILYRGLMKRIIRALKNPKAWLDEPETF